MAVQAHFVKRAKTPHGTAKVAAFADASIGYGDSYYWWVRKRVKFYSNVKPDRVILSGGVEG